MLVVTGLGGEVPKDNVRCPGRDRPESRRVKHNMRRRVAAIQSSFHHSPVLMPTRGPGLVKHDAAPSLVSHEAQSLRLVAMELPDGILL